MTPASPAGAPCSSDAQAASAGCPVAPFLPHATLAGAGLVFLAFFLPWWGLTGVPEDRPGMGNTAQVKSPELLAKNAAWYAKYTVWDRFQNQRDSMLDAARQGENVKIEQVSISLHGWDIGPGVVAFIYFFLVVAIVLGPVFVPMLRPGAWMGYLVSAVVYAGVFGATLISWVICSPGQDVEGQLAQGVSVGVWLALFGSVLAAGAGGMAGLKGFKAWRGGAKE